MNHKLDEIQSPIAELARRGAHLGYSRSRRHPSTDAFVFGFKNRMAVIDLEKTNAALARAASFIGSLGAAGKAVLWVGTKSEARLVIERTGRSLGLPFVSGRWLGGTLTNHSQIKNRLERLEDLEKNAAQGRGVNVSKRDWARSEKERLDLLRYFDSLRTLRFGLPSAVVVVDSLTETIAVTEARKKSIPVVAIANTDCDLSLVDYPIVANDRSQATIEWLVGELAKAYLAGRANAPVSATVEKVTDEPKQ